MAFTYFMAILTALCLAFPALADDFSDYRIPRHHVVGLSGRLNGMFSKSGWQPMNSHSESWQAQGSSAAGLFLLSESDQSRIRVDALGTFDDVYVHNTNRARDPYRHYLQTDRESNLYELWRFKADGRYYPLTFPLGLRANADASSRYRQSWDVDYYQEFHETYDIFSDRSNETWQYSYYLQADLGFGFGKVRDVSGLLNAHIISERLRHDGIITQELSGATRQQLASDFYSRSDYGYRHEFSDKYFWRDVEAVLRSDPALSGKDLDAYTLYRIAEPHHAGGVFRERGWFIGPLARGQHSNEIERYWEGQTYWQVENGFRQDVQHSEHYNNYRNSSDRFLAGASGEYHRPFGVKWQLDLESTLLFPARPNDEHGLDFQSIARFSYFMADRWSASLSFSHQRTDLVYDDSWSEYPIRRSQWYANAVSEVSYQVEDHVAIAGALGFSNSGYRESVSYSPDGYMNRDTGYNLNGSIGIVYHFIGVNRNLYNPYPPPQFRP